MRLLVLSLLALATPALGQLVGLPTKAELSPAGYQLILDFEVGGGQSYYDKFLQRPEWPGESSGVTIGVGYDISTVSKEVFVSDWEMLAAGQRARLSETQPYHGLAAKSKADEVNDILIAWAVGKQVFDRVDVARFYSLTQRAFRDGFDDLRPNAQAALVSLVFNRGAGMSGSSRAEMRDLRDVAVPRKDYDRMASDLRKMKRLWPDTLGLRRRRDAEAELILTP